MFTKTGQTENQGEKKPFCRRGGFKNPTGFRGKKGQQKIQKPWRASAQICVLCYKAAAANTPPRTKLCCGFLRAHLKTSAAPCLQETFPLRSLNHSRVQTSTRRWTRALLLLFLFPQRWPSSCHFKTKIWHVGVKKSPDTKQNHHSQVWGQERQTNKVDTVKGPVSGFRE